MDDIDISREIQTIRILLPHKTTEFEKDAFTFSKIIKRINKYNEVFISKFDEIDKMEKTEKKYESDMTSDDTYDRISETTLETTSESTSSDSDFETSSLEKNQSRNKHNKLEEEDEDIGALMFPNGQPSKPIIDDIHIYIGDIDMTWFKHTHKKFYLMDHEHFKIRMIGPELKNMDGVLCRTTIDLEMIKKIKEENGYNFKIYNTRFTSIFPEKPVLKHWNVVLHFAGEYHRKQTGEILKTWQAYPDLPLIIIVCTEQCYKSVEELLENYGRPKNVHFHKRWLDPEDFILVKNKMGIHLCPSAIEGYGHTINDARKIKSLVITTNIEPINELVDETCAIMINCTSHETKKNGADLCIVSKEDIYDAVMKAIRMNIDDRKKLTEIAFERFLEDTYTFEIAVMDMLNDCKPTY